MSYHEFAEVSSTMIFGQGAEEGTVACAVVQVPPMDSSCICLNFQKRCPSITDMVCPVCTVGVGEGSQVTLDVTRRYP